MFPDPDFKSDTTKVLKAIGLDIDYRDRYRTDYGAAVIERVSTKEILEVPYSMIELAVTKLRGFEQKVLLDQIKALILAQATASKILGGSTSKKIH